jgi:hypothetical protein
MAEWQRLGGMAKWWRLGARRSGHGQASGSGHPRGYKRDRARSGLWPDMVSGHW